MANLQLEPELATLGRVCAPEAKLSARFAPGGQWDNFRANSLVEFNSPPGLAFAHNAKKI